MRMELKARLYADSALKDVFEKIVRVYQVHGKESVSVPYGGEILDISPMSWKDKHDCQIILGKGVGEREQHITNLYALLQQQRHEREIGSPLVDSKKIYNTYEALLKAVDIKGTEQYFNNPEIPIELLVAEIERLTKENNAMSQAVNQKNQLAEAEMIKQQGTTEREVVKIREKAAVDQAKLIQDQMQHDDKIALELTKIEANTGKNVPGSVI
tara:strand:- start:347 stop:985 length:639 start_codon:yes stop_codon:yes gene_type:complete